MSATPASTSPPGNDAPYAPASAQPPPSNGPLPARDQVLRILNRQISYRACVVVFLFLGSVAILTPFKEYYLGNYVTDPFDEVRDDVVARQLNHMGVVLSGMHYFDTFERSVLPLIDLDTQEHFKRPAAANLTLTDFLVRANLRREDLLAGLPETLLVQPVNLMVDVHGPLCGTSSSQWETEPQLLFGNWFPAIRHEFCRDFHDKFPRDRYFNHADKTPVDAHLADVGDVTLGLIAVVNMSEVYLRHFNDTQVIRKIMKNVQEGYLGLELPEYTDDVATAIVTRYGSGIPLADVVALLPGSFDDSHVALVDVLGVSALLNYYLEPQQLTMGENINGEAAIVAEVTHAAESFFTTDFLITTVGMHYASTLHLATFWKCTILHTSMVKTIAVDDVDGAVLKSCGTDMPAILPVFIVNLMFLSQSDLRDYTTLDNATTYTLGHRRESDPEYVVLTVPETFDGTTVVSIDGSSWSKKKANATTTAATTPYGYLYTPDCKRLVTQALSQTGRNVQKYQAYLGDGLGNCAFRDSQETELQTLCRLFMTSDEVMFSDLNGEIIKLPSCASLITATASAEVQALEQENLRQIEWFMIDTSLLTRRIRIQDNTSRQIRTFLLMLNLIGATHYAMQYIYILKSVWTFVSNSVLRPAAQERSRIASGATIRDNPTPLVRLGILELLMCDPADGALEHPATMVLMYLGAVGALSNIFSLGCYAELSVAGAGIVIYCNPAIPVSSLNLVFTTLSSSYWVIRVTLQSRSLAMRLDHVVRDNFVRFWLTNAAAVLVIHFTCKGGADLLLQNVSLQSDPHIYAIIGGFCFALAISTGFLLVHVASTDIKRLRKLVKQGSTKTLSRASIAREKSDRAFVAKWGTKGLDSVLYHCASPQIARQLQVSSVPGELTAWKQGSRWADPTKDGESPAIRIHEYVAVHCAGGVHTHLLGVKWYIGPRGQGGVTTLEPMPGQPRVYCGDENLAVPTQQVPDKNP